MYQECWGDDDPQPPNQDEEVVYGDVKEYEEYEEYEEALSESGGENFSPLRDDVPNLVNCLGVQFDQICMGMHIYIWYDMI